MTMDANSKKYNGNASSCVFQNAENSNWSPDGCYRLHWDESGQISCYCRYIPSFASMTVTDFVIEPPKSFIWISLLGSSICCILLILTIIVISRVISDPKENNEIKKNKYVIHLNLCISLFIAELLFLLGGIETIEGIACNVIAGLMHFFFLAVFFGMFVEAFAAFTIILQKSVKFEFSLWKMLLVSYASPAIIVTITYLARMGHGYKESQFCWIKPENSLAFFVPAIVLTIVNILLIIYALVKARSRTNAKFREQQSQAHILAMTVIPGVTWTIGFIYVETKNIWIALTFAVFNVLQGICFFICLCMLKENCVKELKILLCFCRSSTYSQADSDAKDSAASVVKSALGRRNKVIAPFLVKRRDSITTNDNSEPVNQSSETRSLKSFWSKIGNCFKKKSDRDYDEQYSTEEDRPSWNQRLKSLWRRITEPFKKNGETPEDNSSTETSKEADVENVSITSEKSVATNNQSSVPESDSSSFYSPSSSSDTSSGSYGY